MKTSVIGCIAGTVITVHPTEAKRVTVLEIQRRIYLLLVELELPCWPPALVGTVEESL
ncbi:MAG: hypothetical protein ACREXR_06340 [Gammaproteobacteria bacterium]